MSRSKTIFVILFVFLVLTVFWQSRLPTWSTYQADASHTQFLRALRSLNASESLNALDRLQVLNLVPNSKKDESWNSQVRELYGEGKDVGLILAILELLPDWPEAQSSEWLLRFETHPSAKVRENTMWTRSFLKLEETASLEAWRELWPGGEADQQNWMETIFQHVIQGEWTEWIRVRQLEMIDTHGGDSFAEFWFMLFDAPSSSARAVELALENLWRSPIWTEKVVRSQWTNWRHELRLMILIDLFRVCPEWRNSFLEWVLEHEKDDSVLRGFWQSLESLNSQETRAWVQRFAELWQYAPRHKKSLEFQLERMNQSPDAKTCQSHETAS